MFSPFSSELARVIQRERLDEAQKLMRGFCCTEDRRELEKSRARSNRSAAQPVACGC